MTVQGYKSGTIYMVSIIHPQAGFDPPVAEGPIYWMIKVDALTTQATTAGTVPGLLF